MLRDFYYKEAKKLGFRSRSAIKLLELLMHYQIIKKGDFVVDLGAAPGGWLQVIRDFVGQRGKVIGVDISPIKPLPYDNVFLLRGDVSDPSMAQQIIKIAGRPVDVMVSDLAPKFSGIHDLDHARQIWLTRSALALASQILRFGGNMVMKVIMGSELDSLLREVRQNFQYTNLSKPKASRGHSSEIYLVCRGWKNKTIELETNLY